MGAEGALFDADAHAHRQRNLLERIEHEKDEDGFVAVAKELRMLKKKIAPTQRGSFLSMRPAVSIVESSLRACHHTHAGG